MIDLFARFTAKNYKIIFVISLLLVIPCVWGFASTRINYDILSYLPDELDSVRGEAVLDEVFGISGSAFLVVENMPSKDIVSLKEKINSVDGVETVVWRDTFADITVPYEMLPDELKNIFYSADGTSSLMLIQFSAGGTSESAMNAIESIKKVMNKQCFLSGMSVLMSDTKNVVEGEAPMYVAVAVILAFAALLIMMGSLSLPFIIMASLGLAVIYNMGTNFFGEISYITQSLAVILQLGVTIDYSVFLCDRFTEESERNSDKKEAMAKAISKTFFSVSSSAITTVFGFLALCFMSFTLGTDIGFVMAKGVVFGVVSALFILPSMLMMFYKPSKKSVFKAFIPNPDGLFRLFANHPKITAVIFAVLIFVSYALKNNVDVYYDLVKALPQDMTSVVSLSKLKNEFGMSSTFFAVFDGETESYGALKMADEFRRTDGVTSVLSLGSVVGPAVPYDIIPESVIDLCRKGGYEVMMVVSAYPSSTAESVIQTKKLTAILKKYDSKGMLTGESSLSDDLVGITERDFKITGIISITAVFIVVAILFKSLLIPIILVSCVELAVFINEAIPFFTGGEVPFIAPTVIGCIQLGATVDYAILMTTRVKEELLKGKSNFSAVTDAVAISVKSVFQSAVILFGATFGVYCICNVNLVKSICLMLARGAVISMFVVTVFLPPLLLIAEPFIFKKLKVKNIE